MSKKIARLLKADIQETSDLKSIARMLANKGRGGDTMLAHITPKEVNLLKEAGGSGTVNPETGLLEFFDIGELGYGYGADYASSVPDYSPPQNAPESSFALNFNAPAQQLTPSGIDPTEYYAGQQYAGSDFPYFPATEGMDKDSYRFLAEREFPREMGARTDLAAAQRAAAAASALPQGMMDFPADVGAAARPAIPMPGQAPPTLSERAGDVLTSIKEGGKDIGKFLKENPELAKLGVGGVGALLTALQSRQATKQAQKSVGEQKALAAPYQKLGGEIQRQALAGELSPQELQSLQAAKAQVSQGIESRGGVGVAQAQAQIEALRQNLLQQKLDYGIKLSSIGDNIAIGAIRTGLQADQAVNQLTNSMYSNMLAIASGIPPQQIRTTATPGAA